MVERSARWRDAKPQTPASRGATSLTCTEPSCFSSSSLPFFSCLHLFREFLSAFVPFGGRQTKNRYNETFGLMKLKYIPKFLTPLLHAASCRRNADGSALGILRRMRLCP
jgi:hypothetical protein